MASGERSIELGGTSWWQNLGALAVGAVLCSTALAGFLNPDQHDRRGRKRTPPVVPALIGCGALIYAGYRQRRVLDLDARLLEVRHRWLVIPWSSQVAIGQPATVEMCRSEQRGSGKSRRTVWPVRLHDGLSDPELSAAPDLPAARRLALTVASAAAVPVLDTSAGTEVALSPERLALPAVKRLEAEDLAVKPPQRLRAVLAEEGGGIVITAPVQIWRAAAVAATALLSATVTALVLWAASGLALQLCLAIAGVESIVLGIVLWLVAGRSRLRAFPGSRVVVGRTTIPVEELDDVVVVEIPGRTAALRLLGRRRMVEFGAGIPLDELRFLRAVILRGLKG